VFLVYTIFVTAGSCSRKIEPELAVYRIEVFVYFSDPRPTRFAVILYFPRYVTSAIVAASVERSPRLTSFDRSFAKFYPATITVHF